MVKIDEAITARTIFVDRKVRKVFREEFPETARAVRAAHGGIGDQIAGNIESHLYAMGEYKLSLRFLEEIAEAASIAKYTQDE